MMLGVWGRGIVEFMLEKIVSPQNIEAVSQ